MREIELKAGERRKILHIMFDSIPQTIRFRARPARSGAPVTGNIGVMGSRWLFKKPENVHPLGANNELSKGFWDTNFQVFVTPHEDCVIEFESRHLSTKILFYAIIAVVLLGISAPLFFALMR